MAAPTRSIRVPEENWPDFGMTSELCHPLHLQIWDSSYSTSFERRVRITYGRMRSLEEPYPNRRRTVWSESTVFLTHRAMPLSHSSVSNSLNPRGLPPTTP